MGGVKRMLIFTKMYITTNMKAFEPKKNDKNMGSIRGYEKLMYSAQFIVLLEAPKLWTYY